MLYVHTNINIYIYINIFYKRENKFKNTNAQTHTCTASKMIYNRFAASLKFDTVSANVTA